MPTATDNPVSLHGVQGQPLQALCAAVVEPGADGLCWHQLLPLGHFRGHHQFPDFEVTPLDVEQIVANFTAGLPSSSGVPIDEDGRHQQRGEGAFGWIKQVESRGDGLYGGIEWGEDGLAALKAGRYKHLSAVVFLQKLNPFPVTEWMPVEGSVLTSCAMTTRPFFYQQAELPLAATQFLPMEAAATTEVDPMDATQAREALTTKLGTAFSDEEWAKVIEGVTDFDKLVAEYTGEAEPVEGDSKPVEGDTAVSAEDVAAKDDLIASLQAELAEAKSGQTVAVEATQKLEGRIGAMERENRDAKLRNELAGVPLANGRMLTPAAVDLLAPLMLNAGEGGDLKAAGLAATALVDGLKLSGGVLETYLPGEMPALAATQADGNDDEAWWKGKSKDITDRARTKTEGLKAAQNLPTFKAAYDAYLGGAEV